MKLLSGLFRQAPPEPTLPAPVVQPAAPAVDPSRIAAIGQLPFGEELAALAGVNAASTSASMPEERRAAQQRVVELLEGGLVDARFMSDLVVDGPSSRIRQLAAEAIQDPAAIRQLIREARGKDKNAYKILKQKSDALLAEERQAAAIQADIAAVRAALERHAHWPYDPLYAPTLDHLSERWAALVAHASPEDRVPAEEALARCRAAVAEHAQAAAEQAAREAAAAEEQRQRVLRREAEEAAAAEVTAALEAEEKARADKQAEETLAWRRIGGLIGKTQSILKDGSTARAMGLRRAIEEKLQTAPGAAPAHITRQLQQLDEKLNLLQDWRKFAVVPKRAQLIDEMEALIGFSEDPNVLARQIKQLQDEWRTVSKGGGSDAEAEAEWQRFHQAAQAAYQPCREYFEAQAKLRQENLEKRKALLERIEAFEARQDWEKPDWRLVATALRESRREWYSHTPVERAAVKQIQESFDAVTARLEEKLEAENARNIKDKKSVIAKAQRLLNEPDSRKAIDEVKRLQELWKETGPVPHKDDRKLWEEFRKHCDAVFQKRQQQHIEHAKGLEAAQAQAVALCEEAEAIAALSGADLTEGMKKIPALREAFEALGELPRASARKTQDRFERALKKCDAALAQKRAGETAQSWSHLLEAADLVRKYRLAAAVNADDREALKLAAQTYMAGVQRWPKNGQQTLQAQLAREDATDPAANEAALRMLCIRAEVLTDTPTPPEDQSLRREYQVKRLMQSMGQGAAGAENMDALTMEWAAAGPVQDEMYTRLSQRFQRCRG